MNPTPQATHLNLNIIVKNGNAAIHNIDNSVINRRYKPESQKTLTKIQFIKLLKSFTCQYNLHMQSCIYQDTAVPDQILDKQNIQIYIQ